jgi:hypothetical protein
MLAALATGISLQAAPPQARDAGSLAPPETNLIARLDLDEMHRSTLLGRLRADYQREVSIAETLMSLVVGFVPEDIGRVWLYASEPQRGVILLEGRFSAARIATKLRRLDGIESLEIPGVPYAGRMRERHEGRITVVAVLSDRLLALGEAQAMQRMLAAWRGEIEGLPGQDPALQSVARSGHHLAATLREPAAWSALDPKAATLVDRTFLKGRLTEDLRLELDIEGVDDVAAEALENVLRGWLLIEQRNPRLEDQPALQNALRSADLTRQARLVRLSLELSGEQIARELASRSGAHDDPQARQSAPPPLAP